MEKKVALIQAHPDLAGRLARQGRLSSDSAAEQASAGLDRLTADGRHELDRGKRIALYHRVQEILADEVPIIPLWHEDNVVLANASLAGYRITPNARLIGLVSTTKAGEAPVDPADGLDREVDV